MKEAYLAWTSLADFKYHMLKWAQNWNSVLFGSEISVSQILDKSTPNNHVYKALHNFNFSRTFLATITWFDVRVLPAKFSASKELLKSKMNQSIKMLKRQCFSEEQDFTKTITSTIKTCFFIVNNVFLTYWSKVLAWILYDGRKFKQFLLR